MNLRKDEKIKEILKQAAAEFFSKENDCPSILTVTSAETSDNGKKAIISFTAYPEKDEALALKYSKRKRSEFREYTKEKTGLVTVPFVDFAIDFGEKNRQKIEALSINNKKTN